MQPKDKVITKCVIVIATMKIETITNIDNILSQYGIMANNVLRNVIGCEIQIKVTRVQGRRRG